MTLPSDDGFSLKTRGWLPFSVRKFQFFIPLVFFYHVTLAICHITYGIPKWWHHKNDFGEIMGFFLIVRNNLSERSLHAKETKGKKSTFDALSSWEFKFLHTKLFYLVVDPLVWIQWWIKEAIIVLWETANFPIFTFNSASDLEFAQILTGTQALYCERVMLCGSDSLFWHAIRTFTFPKCAGQATIRMLSSGVYLFYEITFMKFCLSLK